jgi:hypothetical protein
MEGGEALFVMYRDYRYAALVLPLHLDRWNATERKQMSKRVHRLREKTKGHLVGEMGTR